MDVFIDYKWFMNFRWEIYSQLVYYSYLLHVPICTHIVEKSSSISVMGNAMCLFSNTPLMYIGS